MDDFLKLKTTSLARCESYDPIFLNALTDFADFVLTSFFSAPVFHEVDLK